MLCKRQKNAEKKIRTTPLLCQDFLAKIDVHDPSLSTSI